MGLTSGPRTAVFSSSPTTLGSLLFDYLTPTSYAPQHPLTFLSDLQTHRRVHGIIGILDASEYTSKTLASALAAFQVSLKDLPKTFATKVYGFDPTEEQLKEGRELKDGESLVMVPQEGDVSFYLRTVLADFASDVLWEFSNMVRPSSPSLSRTDAHQLHTGRTTRVKNVHSDTARTHRQNRSFPSQPVLHTLCSQQPLFPARAPHRCSLDKTPSPPQPRVLQRSSPSPTSERCERQCGGSERGLLRIGERVRVGEPWNASGIAACRCSSEEASCRAGEEVDGRHVAARRADGRRDHLVRLLHHTASKPSTESP